MPDILSKEQLLRLSMADMVQSVYMRLTITALCEALDEQEGETRWTDTVLPRLLPYTCDSDGVPRKDFTVGELLKYAGDLMSDKATLPDSLPEGSNPEQEGKAIIWDVLIYPLAVTCRRLGITSKGSRAHVPEKDDEEDIPF